MIVDALIMGYTDGQDILTLSLGGAAGWTESASSVVASRIAATGTIVTIAAGNDVRAIPSFLYSLYEPGFRVLMVPGFPLALVMGSTSFRSQV